MRTFNILLKYALLAILTLFIGLLAIFSLLQTQEGQRRALDYLLQRLEQQTHTQIRAAGLEYEFPFHFRFEDLSVVQDKRPLLSIGSLEGRCTLSGFLGGGIVFSMIQAHDVRVHGMLKGFPDRPRKVISLPLYFKVEELVIQRAQFDPNVIAAWPLPLGLQPVFQDALFHLQGSMSYYSFERSPSARLLVTMESGEGSAPLCTAHLESQDDGSSLSLHCQKFPWHSLLPSRSPAFWGEIVLDGSASNKTWLGVLQGHSETEAPIKGSFQLSLPAPPIGGPSWLYPLIGPHATLHGQYHLFSRTKLELFDLKADTAALTLEGQALCRFQKEAQEGSFKGKANLSPPLAPPNQIFSMDIEGSVGRDERHHTFLCKTNLNTPSMRLIGGISYDTDHSVWDGQMTLQTKNFLDIPGFWTFGTSGEGRFDLQLYPTKLADSGASALPFFSKQQGFQLALEGKNLRGSDWRVDHIIGLLNHADALDTLTGNWEAERMESPQGRIERAAGKASFKTPFSHLEGTLEIALEQVQTPFLLMENVEGATRFSSQASLHPFRLRGRGAWGHPFSAEAEGAWNVQSNAFEVQTRTLEGMFGPYPLRLLEPMTCMWEPDASAYLGIQSLHFQLGESEIQAEGRLQGGDIAAQLTTTTLSSELLHFLLPEVPMSGQARLEGSLEGPLDMPRGKLHIDVREMQIKEDVFAATPLINGQISLFLGGKDIRVSSELHGIGRTPLRLSGTVPITFSLTPLAIKMDAALPFTLNLDAEGELNPYLHLFYNDAIDISGQAKIALKLMGTLNDPHLRGYANFLNGTYESIRTGTVFHDIQAHLQGDGSNIVLTHFSARDNKQGTLTATGQASLNPRENFPFNIRLNSSRLFVLNSDYASISASGPLSLVGNTKKASLQGRLTIDHAILHLGRTLPRQIKTVEVKYVNLPNHASNYQEKKEKHSNIELDVELQAPRTVNIQDSHLKSEWKGSIALMGTPEHPLLYGDLQLAEGSYDFNGKLFNLTQGNIHFSGAPEKKTTLYVTASKEIDRIRAEIIVKGQVNKPVISFRSSPPLSQREVLSYILFNRGISDITADQGDQLSQSFVSLNSSEQTQSGNDFLSRLRNNMGIDRLDFTTKDQENKEFGLQVGKNITENVSLSVNQSMTSTTPIIAVEARLRKNLKAQAEAGVNADAPVRMSIKWKKDY